MQQVCGDARVNNYFVLLVFLLNSFVYAADVRDNLFDKVLGLSLGARYIDTLSDLAAISRTKKSLYAHMSALHAERCSEFKNYIKTSGIDEKKITYAQNELEAYFVQSNPGTQFGASLVSISHYGNVPKKKKLYVFKDPSVYADNVLERVKPFVIDNAVYMYETYTTHENQSGVLVRVPYDGKAELVVLYCKVYDHIPSGWLAEFVPKLHDELLNTGAPSCAYYPWSECKNAGLKKIKEQKQKEPSAIQGVVVFDMAMLKCISETDKKTLHFCSPEVFDAFAQDVMFGVTSYSNIHSICSPLPLMHMSMSWGEQKDTCPYLCSLESVKHKIPNYGTFKVSAFTEKISFHPCLKGVKSVKNKLGLFFSRKTAGKIVVSEGDATCAHVLDYLKKQGAFVTKDWHLNREQLSTTLDALSQHRFIFKYNDMYAGLLDTITSSLYVITLNQNGVPTVQRIPSIKIETFELTRNGYTFEHQPDEDQE